MESGIVKVHCPGCGQKLAVGSVNMARSVQCPRCHQVHQVANLIDVETTVAVVDLPAAAGASSTQPPLAVPPPPVPTPPGALPLLGVAPAVSAPPPAPGAWPGPPAGGPVALAGAAPPLAPAWSVPPPAAMPPPPYPTGAPHAPASPLAGVTGPIAAAAAWLDATLHGRRWPALAVAALVAVAGAFADDALARWFFQLPFIALAGLLLLALVASVTSPEPPPEVAQFERPPTDAESLQHRGQLVAGVGLVALAVGNIPNVVSGGDLAWAILPGCAALFVGAAAWLIGWQQNQTAPGVAERRAMLQAFAASVDPPRLTGAVLALPPVVDIQRGFPAAVSAVHNAQDPLVRELCKLLCDWRPGRRAGERGYQIHLLREIERRLPGAEPREGIGGLAAGRPLRADIVVWRGVLLVVEHGPHDAREAQRMRHEIDAYAELWKQRGPVVLVACDPDPRAREWLPGWVQERRQRGEPVVAVLVPPWRPGNTVWS